MSGGSWLLLLLVLLLSLVYYVLSAVALKDLYRRPGVRTGNKVGWALAILCLPIVGALLYEHWEHRVFSLVVGGDRLVHLRCRPKFHRSEQTIFCRLPVWTPTKLSPSSDASAPVGHRDRGSPCSALRRP